MGQKTRQRRLMLVMVTVTAAAIRAVGTQRSRAVPTIGTTGRPVAFASTTPDGLHAATATAGRHTLSTRVADSASRCAQLEFQETGVSSCWSREIALCLVRPTLEFHYRSALANQTTRSLSLFPRPIFKLQNKLLVESTTLRRVDVLLNEGLRPTLDLENAALAALWRVLGAQRLHRQPHVLQAWMIRLRREIRRATNVQQQVISISVKFRR